MQKVSIEVPATSANLGPGFDCLGLALALYNKVTFTAVSQPALRISVSGTDAEKVARDETNLVYQCAQFLFDKAGHRPPGLHIRQENNIPVGSGLGSSSTAVLAGLLGANELLRRPFTTEQILQFAVEIEGHPDNVLPAYHGSLVLGVLHEHGLHVERFSLPALKVVVVLPDFHLPTAEAREVLPHQVPLRDAIFNASRTPLLIRALQTGDYAKLTIAMQDVLHQTYRIPLIPGMAAAFAAAQAAGAKAVALSGAGPSLIAFAAEGHDQIEAAATAVFTSVNRNSRSWILEVDNRGSQIKKDTIDK